MSQRAKNLPDLKSMPVLTLRTALNFFRSTRIAPSRRLRLDRMPGPLTSLLSHCWVYFEVAVFLWSVTLRDPVEPFTDGLAGGDISEHPRVRMFSESSGQEGEVAGGIDSLEVGPGCGDMPFTTVADELRLIDQTFQTGQGKITILVRIGPPVQYAIVMAVTDETAPQRGNLIVSQSDVIAGDGPAGKPARTTAFGSPPYS